MTESAKMQRLTAYADLLREIKQRHLVLDAVLTTKVDLAPRFAYELGYLQLRMICELVALGCLVVHGDIPTANSKELRKAYSADFILATLTKLHPDFFPYAITQQKSETLPDGRTAWDLVRKTQGFISKQGLIKLYHRCGDVLHRGTVQRVSEPLAVDMQALRAHVSGIVGLLNQHRIQSIDPDIIYVAIMQRESDGNVEVNWLQKITQPPA